jgi:hypothetical protein
MKPAPVILPPLCAADDTDAARIIGIKTTKLWELCNLPKTDPRRIKKTSYGKIPYAELQRHLAEEMKAK